MKNKVLIFIIFFTLSYVSYAQKSCRCNQKSITNKFKKLSINYHSHNKISSKWNIENYADSTLLYGIRKLNNKKEKIGYWGGYDHKQNLATIIYYKKGKEKCSIFVYRTIGISHW